MNRGSDYAIKWKHHNENPMCIDVILRVLRKVLYFGIFLTHCDTRDMETKNRWEGSELQRSFDFVREKTHAWFSINL